MNESSYKRKSMLFTPRKNNVLHILSIHQTTSYAANICLHK